MDSQQNNLWMDWETSKSNIQLYSCLNWPQKFGYCFTKMLLGLKFAVSLNRNKLFSNNFELLTYFNLLNLLQISVHNIRRFMAGTWQASLNFGQWIVYCKSPSLCWCFISCVSRWTQRRQTCLQGTTYDKGILKKSVKIYSLYTKTSVKKWSMSSNICV